jgi:hypothetical protein
MMGTTAKDIPSFRPKNRIDHAVYGLGTIVEVNERYTTIAFDGAGTRKFVTTMVKLVGSDTPAPGRPSRRKERVTPPATTPPALS